jgi:hypothetical protein
MKLDELETQCQLAVIHGHTHVTLVVPRKSPPTGDHIRVKGLGQGYVMNAQQKNGQWEIVASFCARHILNTVDKQRKLNELHTSS